MPPGPLLATAAAWVAAGLNLDLLFDLKATLTTLAALVLLTGLALPGRAAGPVLVAATAPAVVFAAFVVHPLAALAAFAAALWGLARLVRPLAGGVRAAWMLAAGTAVLVWPAWLGLVSNAVVEVACPTGGLEQPCYGFYRVGAS